MSVNIDPTSEQVSATRSLRKSGSSVVLTFPPELIQALDLSIGDEMKMTGDWGEKEIRVEPVE